MCVCMCVRVRVCVCVCVHVRAWMRREEKTTFLHQRDLHFSVTSITPLTAFFKLLALATRISFGRWTFLSPPLLPGFSSVVDVAVSSFNVARYPLSFCISTVHLWIRGSLVSWSGSEVRSCWSWLSITTELMKSLTTSHSNLREGGERWGEV